MNETLENTVASLEQLRNTPSNKEGFSHHLERDIRLLACNFIKAACVILELYTCLTRPQNTAATAQVLIQRYYFVQSIGELPLFNVIGASIYLASKLEESGRRLRDIITTLDYLYKKSEKLAETPLDISSTVRHN